MQEAILKEKEKIERQTHLAILGKELRIFKQLEEKIQEKIRSMSHSRSSKSPTQITHYEKEVG